MNGLRIFFRQHQLTDIDSGGINVVVNCGATATYVPGNVPLPDWVEMTAFTEGLNKLQLSWDAVNQGATASNSSTNQIGSNYDKGISLDLTFFGDAFNYIDNWLLTNQCQILNSIDVRIDDTLCGKSFRLFEIKADNLKYFKDVQCRIDVKLREQDLTWHCVHKTFIWDNHQNWFNQTGTSTKEHPTFLVAVEPRPRILSSVRLGFHMFLLGFPSGTQDLIIELSGYSEFPEARRILEIDHFVPAPLIRDYIDNAAAKCGLSVDTMFHRPGTPEYSACLLYCPNGNMYDNDDDTENAPSHLFIFENRWDVTLAEFLDKLKVLYSAEWYVTPNNTVVFKPVTELISLAPIYDFTSGPLELRDVAYTFSGTKKAAYGRYQYQPDGSDLGSQEIANLYNDIADYDGPMNNPMLEGEKSKFFEFASQAFIRDGRAKDYLRETINDAKIAAMVILGVVAVATIYLLAGVLTLIAAGVALAIVAVWLLQIRTYHSRFIERFCESTSRYGGCPRLVSANQTITPRIIIWNGNYERSETISTHNPTPNLFYNPNGTPYEENNSIGTNNGDLNIYNYSMYFDSKYEDNMFDRFHEGTDNPLKSLETNQTCTGVTDLCCDTMTLFGLWEGDFTKIGYLIKVEQRTNYSVYCRIESIKVNYDNYTISIKGKVIKR